MQELTHVIGFDQDAQARALASARLEEVTREGASFEIIADNFR